MNDTTSSPSRLLKVTAVTARWLLGCLIAAWLLVAVSVAVLHTWIVPRIGDYRAALEAQASKSIGVPVRIGGIAARSTGLFPVVELSDVTLLDARQQPALHLARVVISVSPRSLWRLSFEQIYLGQPRLEVRRDTAGKLHVAGLDMTGGTTTGEARGADWFFRQREFAIEGGTVRWTDESRQAPPLLLTDVSFVLRNTARRHSLRLDATPPDGWGERFSLRGRFRQPLLSVRSGNWHSWEGQAYAEFPRIDASHLRQYLTLDETVQEGRGALRAWLDVEQGAVRGVTADLALGQLDVRFAPELPPLALHSLTGRLAFERSPEGVEASTTGLQFETALGARWPGGNVWFQQRDGAVARGALRADRLDLAALAAIAESLPIAPAHRRWLDRLRPQGQVERVEASWQGPPDAPQRYQLKGRVAALAVAAEALPAAPGAAHPPAGRPGVRGATVEFDASSTGGQASVAIADGALEFPGVFDEPVIPIERLSTQLRWTLDGPRIQLQVSQTRFANADAEGEAQASWRTADGTAAGADARFPGVLDLQGRLSRANGARVYRYLPRVIPDATRSYVQQAVRRGVASGVEFKVRGDLRDMPFDDARRGQFRIAANVAGVSYAYVPPGLQEGPAWPALENVSGELVFEGAGMAVRNARGRVAGAGGIEISSAQARIADMAHAQPLLQVEAQARGPLGELLRVGAPLAGEAGRSLADVRAGGDADYRLRLALPLNAMEAARLQASIALTGNEIQAAPDLPALAQARGTLEFTESEFTLRKVEAQALGGSVRLEGAGRFGAPVAALRLRAQGTATAQGLREATGADALSALAPLARRASGEAAYAASVNVERGAVEFSLNSNMQGLGLDLPAPLAKAEGAVLPLVVEKKLLPRESAGDGNPAGVRDQVSIALGRVASATYVRDLGGAQPRVLRGSLALGTEAEASALLPSRGVAANLRFDRLDVPAWLALIEPLGGSRAGAAGAAGESPWLPDAVALQAGELAIGGRTLHQVVLGSTREGNLWRTNIDAQELSGYAEYRHAQAGRLYARLARLRIAPSEATAVESLLDEQPEALPALDIVIDDFELLGRRLGRAEIDAVNRGGAEREWRLNRLLLTNEDASFSAQGSWAATAGRGTARRTAMAFNLQIADAGALLGRFGMADLVRRGRGRLDGEVEWTGSPFSLHYPTLDGRLQIDVASGQFLKAEPGIAKLLGVLSLQALPRRLALDFRDVFSQGFAFDFVRGDARIGRGVARTNNLQMKGVNAAVLMDGSADLARETQDLRVVVVPEINAGTAALVATAINPAIGLGTFLAQMVLSKPLVAAATQEFHIDGSWADPKITRVPRRLLPEALKTPLEPLVR